VIGQSASHPEEVFALDLPEASPRRLTFHNDWLSELRLAAQETVRYRARDGLELEGVLIRPLEVSDAGTHHLIVSVHGGPEAHESNGWKTSYSRPGQVAAARGFAVFYPNYRGSTGRGVEFSKLGQADYAGKEFDDLVDGVRHLVGLGLVDEKRVGVTGGSYGGYATAWCATRLTEHFAAGVMFVGLSDVISKFGTTDIPEEMTLVHARKEPWDDWDFFLDRSPIKHAGQGRTPLLILHGKDDPRVHPSQSLEMYRYLRTRTETPVRLVLYPGEGLGNARSAARLDYQLRMIQWFEHYLMGPGGEPPAHELEYPFEPEPKE
jgi:dipeptidyl aminopeptidase/acylaminoacyl peptidase